MGGRNHSERVIGGTPEEQRLAMEELQGVFDETDPKLVGYEVEKSTDEKAMIERVEAIVDEMVKKWGGDPKPVPLKKIQVLKPGAVDATSDGSYGGRGVHKPLRGNIGVERTGSRVGFGSVLSHELFHLKSYKSAQIDKWTKEADLYRSGFSMIDRKNPPGEFGKKREYFSDLEEGIVAECANRFFDRMKSEPLFEKEMAANEKIKQWVLNACRRREMPKEKLRILEREWKYIPDAEKYAQQIESFSEVETEREDFAWGTFSYLYENNKVEIRERYSQRNRLYQLCDEICAKSGGRFVDSEAVFNEFAKANFTGNYLTIGRVVDGALGKGSFRRLAEETSGDPGNNDARKS